MTKFQAWPKDSQNFCYLCLSHCKCSEKLISDYLDHYTSKRWPSWMSAMVSPSEGAGGHGGEADQAADWRDPGSLRHVRQGRGREDHHGGNMRLFKVYTKPALASGLALIKVPQNWPLRELFRCHQAPFPNIVKILLTPLLSTDCRLCWLQELAGVVGSLGHAWSRQPDVEDMITLLDRLR